MWTVRQKAYVESLKLDTLYTPQVVVHGRTQCIGTDQAAILAAIRSAPRYPSPMARFEKSSAHLLQVSFSGSLRSKVDSKGADVMVALYESGLLTNNVDKGENKGCVLNNDYVVRRMEKLISVKDASARKKISGTVNFSLWDGFSSIKCDLLLSVQNNSLQTFGVQHFKIPYSI